MDPAALPDSVQAQGLTCAQRIAEHFCVNQIRPHLPGAGAFPGYIGGDGPSNVAGNWMHAFACMGLLSAARAFGEPRYERAACRMGGWLKTLQIFDPFHPNAIGAIRETTPQSVASHPRDALSVAWAFIELHRHTGDREYLDRAIAFGTWFMEHALDETGWPLWTVHFEDGETDLHTHNDIHGSFHGGSLNLFYQLALATGDDSWVGPAYLHMADYLLDHIQQPSGYFVSIHRDTRQPPADDPQNALHRGNDDLSTLGLLGAHAVTGDGRYLDGIRCFLDCVYAAQREDGGFEDSVAAIPVVLNISMEAAPAVESPAATPAAVEHALSRLYAAQADGATNPMAAGALHEVAAHHYTTARSTAYALIVLLKLFAGCDDYLTVQPRP
jgi:uncharacterized protein YyaL (SSP411 family)